MQAAPRARAVAASPVDGLPGSMHWVASSPSKGRAETREMPSKQRPYAPCPLLLLGLLSGHRLVKVWRQADAAVALPAQRGRAKSRRWRQQQAAQDAWGGGTPKLMEQHGLVAMSNPRQSRAVLNTNSRRWVPDPSLWDGYVKDDDVELFGPLAVGDEVEIWTDAVGRGSWVAGLIIAIDEPKMRVAVTLEGGFGTVGARRAQGQLRRREDDPRLLPEEELAQVTRMRAKEDVTGLLRLGEASQGVALRSRVVSYLCRLGEADRARMLASTGITSLAMRDLALELAATGKLAEAGACIVGIDAEKSGQLLLEVLAVGLTSVVQAERERLGVERYLRSQDKDKAVLSAARWVQESLPLLEEYEAAIVREAQRTNSPGSLGLTEALNELVRACSRAAAPALAFRVMAWMDRLRVMKDGKTYEAIGSNVVKRVQQIAKVWDLPMAPEEGYPEVVFAGRSNVGKSSLVNMLLTKKALAATSSKPGRTRTMDFYEANAGISTLPRFRLVDVPGLGYARVSRDLRERWILLLNGYFAERKSLKLVFHLIDASLGEVLPSDRDLWKLLAEARREDYEVCIALTKADGSSPASIERFAGKVRSELDALNSRLMDRAAIFACSSKTRLGKDTLWRKIWTAIGADPLPNSTEVPAEAEASAQDADAVRDGAVESDADPDQADGEAHSASY
mmetsp:Transcript_21272/g.38821  ORF Transcript_21272/g.38821 Transcript_21272/m.38821 type:complete len:680 (-) Transcript_21272:33-2072(-)